MASKNNPHQKNKNKNQSKTWRNIVSIIFLVIGSILVPLAVGTIWLHSVILNTNTYVNTVAPLSFNQDIDNDIARVITNRLSQRINVSEQVGASLPEQGQFLVPALADRLQGFTQTQISRVLGTDQFNKIWVAANKAAHPQIVKLLTGGGEVVQASNGQVVLDLGAVVDLAKSKLDSVGINIFDNVSLGIGDREITLFQSPQLAKAQSFIGVLNQLVYVLPLLAIIFFAAAIITATNRFQAVFRTGIGIGLGGIALVILLLLAKNWYVGMENKLVFSPASASAFYDTITRYLWNASWVVVIIGLIIIAALFLLKRSTLSNRFN